MDPFLVSAIGQIGSKLIDRILPEKQPEIAGADSLQEFSKFLEKISSEQNNPLANYLQENGIDSWEKLESHIDTLKGSIREQLYSNIGYETYEQGDWTVKSNQGNFQLIDPRGEIHSLDYLPEVQENISQLQNLSLFEHMHTQFPGQPIAQLSSNFSPNTQGNLSWNL